MAHSDRVVGTIVFRALYRLTVGDWHSGMFADATKIYILFAHSTQESAFSPARRRVLRYISDFYVSYIKPSRSRLILSKYPSGIVCSKKPGISHDHKLQAYRETQECELASHGTPENTL
jgi:hypothetical protein